MTAIDLSESKNIAVMSAPTGEAYSNSFQRP